MADIQILSLNVRGLRDDRKRREIFHWLKDKHNGKKSFVLLQETHSQISDEDRWRSEWGSHIEYNHGSNNSRGVAILFPLKTETNVLTTKSDPNGRTLLIEVECCDITLKLYNLYAPTQDNKNEQSAFFNNVISDMESNETQNMIVAGDLNMYFDIDKDKYPSIGSENIITKSFTNDLDRLNYIDIWRIKHPLDQRYTWRRHFPLQQSRLDYFLIPVELAYCVETVDIKPSIKTDHSLLQLKLNIIKKSHRGPGLWKFNDSLLKDIQYVTEIKTLINDKKIELQDMQDNAQKWEIIKFNIREKSIQFSKQTAKMRKQFENELYKKYNELTEKINIGDVNENILAQLQHTKQEIENLNTYKTEGERIRAKAERIEKDEKCNAYFLQSSHRNYNIKHITKLMLPNGNFITNDQDISQFQTQFYETLYDKRQPTDDFDETFLTNLPQLSPENQQYCSTPITIHELTETVKRLKRGKTPGTDGLSADFYKFFWLDIKDLVHNSILYALENRNLSTEQRRSIITLIPKKEKDLTDIRNWRPISLLNTDYKLITTTLANRLQNVLQSLIANDQTAYLKGRFIGFNIRTIIDIIEDGTKTDSLFLAFLDFEKAFDSLDHNFMHKCLINFGFPQYFRSWVEIIYNKIEGAVINNGYTTKYFQIKRGVRQGCPLSALLFILIVEVLAIAIRNNPNIKGYHIKGTNVKITQFADDTTIITKDILSLQLALNIINMFYQETGLKLNFKKTEIMIVGTKSDYYTNNKPYLLKWKKERIYALGTWFFKDEQQTTISNMQHKLQKLQNIINMWKTRKLTLFGRITVMKSLLLSQINYNIATIYTSAEFLKNIQNIIHQYIWKDKPPKIKQQTIIANREQGGANMTHIESYINAQKLSWIRRLLVSENQVIRKRLESLLGDINLKHYVHFNMTSIDIPQNIPAFYKQILSIWFENKQTINQQDNILKQTIWFNNNIKVGSKMLWNKKWYKKGIIFIEDLIDGRKSFYTLDEFNKKYDLNENFLTYASIMNAIRHFQQMITSMPPTLFEKLKQQNVDINLKTSKEVYNNLRNIHTKPPTCIKTWEEQYNITLNENQWEIIFSIPWQCTKNVKTIETHFKILHKIYPSNSYISRFDNNVSYHCSTCKVKDSTVHMFFECLHAMQFWKEFDISIGSKFGILTNFQNVLLGYIEKDDIRKPLNFCVLYAKTFIVMEKQNNNNVNCIYHFDKYCRYMKHIMLCEKECHLLKEKYDEVKSLFE